jgi:glycerol-3-phosphate dehydrogenase subunit C
LRPSQAPNDYPSMIRGVVDGCADCDTCRFLMDECCLLFPELYRLYDREKEQGSVVGKQDLSRLSELCTLCGLCPCPDIPMRVIRGKTDRARAEGMPLSIRLLADMQRFGRLSALAPRAVNFALSFAPIRRLARKTAGIHPLRRLPPLPDDNFFAWARRNRLDRKPRGNRKVAYFAGCTAGYLFPQVARAAVTVLQRSGIAVFVPPQQCCGMPTLVEGDEKTTLHRARFNLNVLMDAIHDGFDVVCSCPTCGFLMKALLGYRAHYAEAYQRTVGAGADEIKVPDARKASADGFLRLKKSIYGKILKDDGYFSGFDPLDRVALSENVTDAGAYLERLHRNAAWNPAFGRLKGRMVYYAPCHQRVQGTGSPYPELLAKIPGLRVDPVGGALDCCGMGGSLGLKKGFYNASIRLAAPLINKIQAAAPDAIITECLSCRLQFQHLLPYAVYHPLEIISASLARTEAGKRL